MKRKIFALFVLVALVFSYCSKEHSCEGCLTSNEPPVAKAGMDIIIGLPRDSVRLDGSASYDPDGTIKKFNWSKISGPSSCVISHPQSASTMIKNLTQGSYQFELKVLDDKGSFATDTVMVTIYGAIVPVNLPPIANAGADQTITLPTNTAILDGSASTDPNNNITAYQWSTISGPGTVSLLSPNAVQTQVTSLVEGTYQFELKVTDGGGLVSKDTVQIIVVDTSFTEVIIPNHRWFNACYDPRPGVCWVNSDSPSYGFQFNNLASFFPNPSATISSVWIKMDTSSVWEQVPNNCWIFPDPYPQTNYTYCIGSDTMTIYSWFFTDQNLEGRKADVKIRF